MDYLSRPDVTIVTHFRSRASGKELVVANCHISFVGYTLRDLQALQTTTGKARDGFAWDREMIGSN